MRSRLTAVVLFLFAFAAFADEQPRDFAERGGSERPAGRHFLLEPQRVLSDADRADLAARGCVVLRPMTNGRYLVRIAPGSTVDADSVRVAATGGNTFVLGNVELRLPSPVFQSRLRLATFVDAGGTWNRQGPGSRVIRVTPGIGIRLATPLGPARLDVAYNPYKLQPGALFQFDAAGNLSPVPGQSSYVLSRARKFTFHFAVGQPF